MYASIDELRGILQTEGILADYIGTRDSIARCHIIFRQSSQFAEPISFGKIGSILGFDVKTA
jgi:hypothetical protein